MELKEVITVRLHILLPRQAPELSRGSMIDLTDTRVKAPYAAEAGSQCNLAHGQPRFVDKFLGKVQPTRPRHRHRWCSEISQKQAAKMACSNSQPFGKDLDVAVLQTTFTDQT
jgi:hypothetical protein